jgi:hypothetical protein
MDSLAARLKHIKESSNASLRSDSRESTPLKTFLYIYSLTSRECYKDYMLGARALYKFLAPIELPDFAAIDENYRVPTILQTYEMQEVAKLLATQFLVPFAPIEDKIIEQNRCMRAILHCMYREVLVELY